MELTTLFTVYQINTISNNSTGHISNYSNQFNYSVLKEEEES